MEPSRDSKLLESDPELGDFSAPTTPSLPRPFTSIDWQHGTALTLSHLHDRCAKVDLERDRAGARHNTPTDPESCLYTS